ncbi:alpha-(1,3)-fucosyltransferase C-like [Drosophila serrata]|uniref:alpha-(1,3)-fucosyltransferase C-like n=1 Tax=Drosophila serrata TaxID=7274 RepID=UPI000A1D05ED|nr:alpha-(1,3)-fucosyltransferase C-like [Drosophila serrata]
MTTYKIKAMPLVAKVLNLRRTTTNSQQQKQTDTQKDEASHSSGDKSEANEENPPSKKGSLSESESKKDKARVNRRWEHYARYMNTGKILLAVLVVCAFFGMYPLFRRGQKSSVSQESSVKVIMLWNEDQPKKSKVSAHMECGCVVTNRRKNYEMAVDAFVFNAHRPYSLKYLPQINRTRDFLSVFAARNPLSLAKDPPLPPVSERSLFNLTMTYRLDSQLVWSEYYFTLLNQAKRLNTFRAPSEHYADEMPIYEMQLLENQTRTKDRLAMYLLYEVNEASLPESLYLEELRKHVNLDAYESCLGFQHCNHYRFMLIFDSTACPDYVPTHMYTAMHKFMVPVLIGGGNLNNLVPAQSYISGRDFPNPKDLVAHLKYLAKTPKEYKQYFWWHSLYKLRRNSVPYCQLCSLLQQPPEERRIETSFAKWWSRYQCPKRITTFL